MLDWIFEGIVNWISSVVTDLMDAVSGLFLNVLGTDMTVMEEYFPFVSKAYTIMQYTAWALLFLITVWQLFRAFGGPLTEAENPLSLLAKSAVFALLIGFAKPIFLIALEIARAPYTALMDIVMSADNFTFAGVEAALRSGLVTIVSSASIVGLILLIILEIALGWNYFKLLLEVVERYVVVGVLCYTSPLAYSMGASKSTGQVFRSWCRMVGSQLLLLIFNVWFLRGFSSSVGRYIGTGGALSTGGGSVFLWLFCALAFLKTAQRFDSYLGSIGLNVASTGEGLGVELLMAARVVTGMSNSFRRAGQVFGHTATGVNSNPVSGFASRFQGASFVRDAVTEGGIRMGAGGAIGFVGRMFGGVAAKNGAVLSDKAIASVAVRPPEYSGRIAGDIADRSLAQYFPGMKNQTFSGTEITGGKITTSVTSPEGTQFDLTLYSASQYEVPEGTYSTITAADGSLWYQVASGDGVASFYDAPAFTGSPDEAELVASVFPSASVGTQLRTVDKGIIEANTPNGNSLWYNSAYYAEPDVPHTLIQTSNGVQWYAVQSWNSMPLFEGGEDAGAYNSALFHNFIPGYERKAVSVDSSCSSDGSFEIRHDDGSGTRFYDTSRYAVPNGEYRIYDDASGGHWYAIMGEPTVERHPVYENGQTVYENGTMKTVLVESVKYRSVPRRFAAPELLKNVRIKSPKRKR